MSLSQWCARFAPVAVVGGLCLVLTACGQKTAERAASELKNGADAAGPPQDINGPTPPLSKAAKDVEKQRTEAYDAVVENGYQWTKTSPLSTFSADVNTASYSNVRRHLMQENKLPPKDAVLLAELVNYFPYRYPQPTGSDPVSISLDMAPCPWKPEHYLARIGVRARTIEPSAMPPRNLVFLIDVSGSMQPENRLPLVKQSLDLLINQLSPADKVTIVTYAGDAGVRLPPTPGSQKQVIRDAVQSLSAGGSTHAGGGIHVAYEQATRAFIEGGVNRVILCTDGDFNVGVQNQSELLQLIEQKRTTRVYLTILGFGMGNLKNNNLELLANHGNGHYAYIDTIDEARKVFVEQGGALAVVAKDVKLQIEFNPTRVAAYRLIGYENRVLKTEDFKNDARDAGDMGSGHTVTAFYEIVPPGVKIDLPEPDPLEYQNPKTPDNPSRNWLTARMRYKDPDGNESKEVKAILTDGSEKQAAAEDFRFAAAVVEFGLLLRTSPYKGAANYGAVLQRAKGSASYDPNGHRAEFLRVVEKAQQLQTQSTKD